MSQDPSPARPSLLRELGRWDLTAIGVNQVIGGAVFAAPATLALGLGAWSWVGFAVAGLLSMAVALNFAEAGSRVDGTGGPYLYARAAFGRFVSFEVGWMTWFTRVASWASVVNILADALGFYWPGLRTGVPRTAMMCVVVLAIMAINIRGIRQSSLAVNLLTIGKLTPLGLFIIIGLPFVWWDRLALGPMPSIEQWSTSALMLIFAFGGYEVVPVPAGEARDPRKAVPFAMIATIIIVAIVMTLTQIVALGTYPDLPWSKTPLADASLLFIGGWGALMMTMGAAISAAGNNVGAALSGSRSLFALAEQRDVPSVFARIHPRFRTPDVAIVFTCLCTLALALTGSFATLAPISAVARLLIYAATCASVLVMRRRSVAPFTIPGGPIVPALALAVCVVIIYGASNAQLRAGGYALVTGAVLYLIARMAKAK